MWIEICRWYSNLCVWQSPPTRVVWIEIRPGCVGEYTSLRHHPHGWCGLKSEIQVLVLMLSKVTTHTGGVDWNAYRDQLMAQQIGHHPHGWCGLKFQQKHMLDWVIPVTTHTGGVDWNKKIWNKYWQVVKSPPTRVVWIEIPDNEKVPLSILGHHPHGWCGLKFNY